MQRNARICSGLRFRDGRSKKRLEGFWSDEVVLRGGHEGDGGGLVAESVWPSLARRRRPTGFPARVEIFLEARRCAANERVGDPVLLKAERPGASGCLTIPSAERVLRHAND